MTKKTKTASVVSDKSSEPRSPLKSVSKVTSIPVEPIVPTTTRLTRAQRKALEEVDNNKDTSLPIAKDTSSSEAVVPVSDKKSKRVRSNSKPLQDPLTEDKVEDNVKVTKKNSVVKKENVVVSKEEVAIESPVKKKTKKVKEEKTINKSEKVVQVEEKQVEKKKIIEQSSSADTEMKNKVDVATMGSNKEKTSKKTKDKRATIPEEVKKDSLRPNTKDSQVNLFQSSKQVSQGVGTTKIKSKIRQVTRLIALKGKSPSSDTTEAEIADLKTQLVNLEKELADALVANERVLQSDRFKKVKMVEKMKVTRAINTHTNALSKMVVKDGVLPTAEEVQHRINLNYAQKQLLYIKFFPPSEYYISICKDAGKNNDKRQAIWDKILKEQKYVEPTERMSLDKTVKTVVSTDDDFFDGFEDDGED